MDETVRAAMEARLKVVEAELRPLEAAIVPLQAEARTLHAWLGTGQAAASDSWLRDLLVGAGVTQAELSRESGIQQTLLSRYSGGHSQPSREQRARIEAAVERIKARR